MDKALPLKEQEDLSFLDNPLTSADTAREVSVYLITGAFTVRALFFRPSACNAAFSVTGRAGKSFVRVGTGAFTKGAFNHRLINLHMTRAEAHLTASYLRQQIEGVFSFSLTKCAFYFAHKLIPPPVSHFLNPLRLTL